MSKSVKNLDELESEWKEDIEQEQFASDTKTKKRLSGKLMVDQTLKKSHPLSLRVSDADLEAIQHKAAKAGVPYQTLIKSVLHQFATNQIKV